MRLLVTHEHEGEGIFPQFLKGTPVDNLTPVDGSESLHWMACTIEGHTTYVPDTYARGGVLAQDYDPTELVAKAGQEVTLLAVVYEWLYVKDDSGKTGWLPAHKAISI